MGNGDLKGKTIVRRCPACGKVAEMPLTTYYCSKECGQKMKRRDVKDRPKIVFSKCRVCGDWFEQGVGHHKTTCSEECKKKSFHLTRGGIGIGVSKDAPIAKCRCCGKEFKKLSAVQIFCSVKCRNKVTGMQSWIKQRMYIPNLTEKTYPELCDISSRICKCKLCSVHYMTDKVWEDEDFCSEGCRDIYNSHSEDYVKAMYTAPHRKPNELDKVAHKAREAHMSYGEYVASREYGAHIDKRW